MASGTAQGTLPWSWYSDPELLRQEQERMFRRGSQYAGRSSMPPARATSSRAASATCRSTIQSLVREALS